MELLSNLHPKIVHFSISLFVIYFIFEFSGLIFNKDYLQKSALLLLIFGIIFLIFSVLTGNQAFEVFKNNYPDKFSFYNHLIKEHETYATISVWYNSLVLFFRTYLILKKKFTRKYQFIFVLLSFIGAILILITARYGGRLVYEYGIGTQIFNK